MAPAAVPRDVHRRGPESVRERDREKPRALVRALNRGLGRARAIVDILNAKTSPDDG
jgi:hypothetical protein